MTNLPICPLFIPSVSNFSRAFIGSNASQACFSSSVMCPFLFRWEVIDLTILSQPSRDSLSVFFKSQDKPAPINSTKSSASIASFNPGGISIIVLLFILHCVTTVIKVNSCGIRSEQPFGI